MPRFLLRAEGLALLVGTLALYFDLDYAWLLLVVLFLVPDISFAAYAAGPVIGAYAYNTMHTTIGPIALSTIGFLADERVPVQLGLIWLAHIGIDRLLGYGLKYPTAFRDTHLQRV